MIGLVAWRGGNKARRLISNSQMNALNPCWKAYVLCRQKARERERAKAKCPGFPALHVGEGRGYEPQGTTDRNCVVCRHVQAHWRLKRSRTGCLNIIREEDLARRLEHVNAVFWGGEPLDCSSRGCRTALASHRAILLNCSHIAVSTSDGLYEGLIWHQTAILNPPVYHNLFTLHAKRILVFKIYRKWG